MPLTVQALINGMLLLELVDCGDTRSFIDEQLKSHPPLNLLGAYSSLETANWEIIFSLRVAQDVLVFQWESSVWGLPFYYANDGGV